MTPERLQQILRGVEHCERRHTGHQYPFCENYGCMAMREVLDYVDSLGAKVEELQAVETCGCA